MEEIGGFVGKLGIPGLITMGMAIIYKVTEQNEWLTFRKKTLLVVLLGACVGMFFLLYTEQLIAFRTVADHVAYGIKEGLASIGLFKLGQAVGVFRRHDIDAGS